MGGERPKTVLPGPRRPLRGDTGGAGAAPCGGRGGATPFRHDAPSALPSAAGGAPEPAAGVPGRPRRARRGVTPSSTGPAGSSSPGAVRGSGVGARARVRVRARWSPRTAITASGSRTRRRCVPPSTVCPVSAAGAARTAAASRRSSPAAPRTRRWRPASRSTAGMRLPAATPPPPPDRRAQYGSAATGRAIVRTPWITGRASQGSLQIGEKVRQLRRLLHNSH